MYGLHIRHCYGGTYSLDGVVGANSAQFTIGDPVVRDTDGFLIVATAGLRVEGIADQNITMASDNETVAAKKVSYIPSNYRDLYEADMSAAILATSESQYTDLTGTTGAVQLDQSALSDTSGQFRIVHRDPRGEASTTRVLCNIAELESLAYAQA